MNLAKIFIIIVFLSLFVVHNASAGSSNYAIDAVYINGIQAQGSTVDVQLGTNAQIQVYLEGTGDPTDVRVGAWLGGYEYGSVEETTDVFTVENAISYKKTLYLAIPDDLDVSSNQYTLHVEVYDGQEKEDKEYTLYIEQERHDVSIEDILLSSTTVAPGDYLGVQVRLNNQGYKDENDVKITVSIPDLGISQRVYMDELLSGDQSNAPTAYLTIPSDAAGDHEVLVTVDYSNGYSEITGISYIRVEGELVYDENTFVSVSSIGDLTVGETTEYKVQVTNLAESTKTFTLKVDGLHADYTPQITVPAHSSGEFTFTLTPDTIGSASVFIQVSTNEGLVTEKLMNVTVVEKTSTWFFVLGIFLAVLVVVGIVIYLRRL